MFVTRLSSKSRPGGPGSKRAAISQSGNMQLDDLGKVVG